MAPSRRKRRPRRIRGGGGGGRAERVSRGGGLQMEWAQVEGALVFIVHTARGVTSGCHRLHLCVGPRTLHFLQINSPAALLRRVKHMDYNLLVALHLPGSGAQRNLSASSLSHAPCPSQPPVLLRSTPSHPPTETEPRPPHDPPLLVVGVSGRGRVER